MARSRAVLRDQTDIFGVGEKQDENLTLDVSLSWNLIHGELMHITCRKKNIFQ